MERIPTSIYIYRPDYEQLLTALASNLAKVEHNANIVDLDMKAEAKRSRKFYLTAK